MQRMASPRMISPTIKTKIQAIQYLENMKAMSIGRALAISKICNSAY
jgi:hypothetical protein